MNTVKAEDILMAKWLRNIGIVCCMSYPPSYTNYKLSPDFGRFGLSLVCCNFEQLNTCIFWFTVLDESIKEKPTLMNDNNTLHLSMHVSLCF